MRSSAHAVLARFTWARLFLTATIAVVALAFASANAHALSATYTVVKQTDPDASGQSFSFARSGSNSNTGCGTDTTGFSLSDGATFGPTTVTFSSGTRTCTVTESVPTGWQLESIVCSDGSTPSGNGVAIVMSNNENVTCTFTNKRLDGKITVKKAGTRDTGENGTHTENTYATTAGQDGAVFEYASYPSNGADPRLPGTDISGLTWNDLCTIAGGSCQGATTHDGGTRWLVREKTAPNGWDDVSTNVLNYSGGSSGASPDRRYIADVTISGNKTAAVSPDGGFTSSEDEGDTDTDESQPFVNVRDNPTLPDACGIDVMLLLDRSGSINSEPGEADLYQAAADAFVDGLMDTPTNLRIGSFAASGTDPDDNASFDDGGSALDLDDSADVTTAHTAIDNVYNNTGGGTNWDAGLQLAATAATDLTIFITDGNPTARNPVSGTDDSNSTGDVNLLDLTYGIASANLVKAGQKVLAVGVGSGVTAANLKVVSGPTEFAVNVADPDWAAISDPADLADALKQIANKLCGARIHVRKFTEGDDLPQPVSGWTFTASKPLNATYSFADNPAVTAGNPAEDTILVNGVPAPGATGIGLEETVLPDYAFDDAECQEAAPDDLDRWPDGDSGGAGTNPLAMGTVLQNSDWWCTFRNLKNKGTIEVIKDLQPTDDAGKFDLRIDDVVEKDEAGDGETTGEKSVDTGTHTVGESADDETDLDDYQKSIRCIDTANDNALVLNVVADATGNHDVDVDFGDDIVCTITNVRLPKVIINKVTIPSPDPNDHSFDFTSNQLPQTPAGGGSQAIESDGDFTLKNGQKVETRLAIDDQYSVTESDVYGSGYKLDSKNCTQTVPDQQDVGLRDNQQNDADRAVEFTADPGDVIECTFTNKLLDSLIVVIKTPESQTTYIDGTVGYTYDVTNTGESDLHDVTVDDDRCNPVTGPDKIVGNGDDLFETGETWQYQCTTAASNIFGPGESEVVNTVTVEAKDQDDETVTSQDTAVTKLLTPGIDIEKTGPATAQAGALITYDLAVKNTGNTSFDENKVVLSDPLCQAPPNLVSKNGDATPSTLDPNETWNYQCQVQTQPGQTEVDNVATVTGTDTGEHVVSDTDPAKTVLSQPAVQAAPEVVQSGESTLRGSSGCVTAKYSRASVTGKQIAKVTFFVNGKKKKTLTKPNHGSLYEYKVRTKSLKFGAYRIKAVIDFTEASKTKQKTLNLRFSRCKPPRKLKPKFTG